MSSMARTTTRKSYHRHNHHSNNFFSNFGRNAQAVATDANTYIGAGIATVIAVPVTCALQKAAWLGAAAEFEKLQQQEG